MREEGIAEQKFDFTEKFAKCLLKAILNTELFVGPTENPILKLIIMFQRQDYFQES